MISIIPVLLLTVGPAQVPELGAEALREKTEKTRRLGKLATDLLAVQKKIRKAQLDLEQMRVAAQIKLDESLRFDDRYHEIRGDMIVTETIIGWLQKEDPEKKDPRIQKDIHNLKARSQASLRILALYLKDKEDRNKAEDRSVTHAETQWKAAKDEIARLRKMATKLSVELESCIKALR